MWYVKGTVRSLNSEDIHWEHSADSGRGYPSGGGGSDEEGVSVSFDIMPSPNQYHRRDTIEAIKRISGKNDVPWIAPGHKEWTFDLDKLKEFIPELSSMDWFKGKVSIEPEFETFENGKLSVLYDACTINRTQYKATVAFYIVPEVVRRLIVKSEPPVEIQDSLASFKLDYPDLTKVAFIMMQFGKTKAHDKIVKAIRNVLDSHGLIGVKADDKQYHDDLFPNVMTYLYGCGFGIAVFERIEDEEFNPNVSLEVGYLFAYSKMKHSKHYTPTLLVNCIKTSSLKILLKLFQSRFLNGYQTKESHKYHLVWFGLLSRKSPLTTSNVRKVDNQTPRLSQTPPPNNQKDVALQMAKLHNETHQRTPHT